MTLDSRRPWARLGFAALVVFMLSPMVLHGLWRPLAQALHADANALGLTCAALAVAAVAWLVSVATWDRGPNRFRPGAIAGLVALLFGLLLGKGPAAIGAASAALLAVALFASTLVPWIVPRLPPDMDALARRRKVVTSLVAVLGVVAALQTARISTFMGDSARTELSVLPEIPFLVHHSCLTAYVQAARLAKDGVENVYEAENWPDLSQSARSEAYQKRYFAPFQLDAFAYPPPFLLLPRLLLLPLSDFQAQRALWFAVNGLLLAIGLFTVATWIGGRTQVRALLISPLVLISFPTLISLQIGNVHAAVLVLAMLAMVAFERDRPALGGAMLAFAIVSKISPALLVVVLLVQRRFREVLWTAGFGFGFVLLTLAVFGVAPLEAFLVYQLPHLSSGEALSFLAWDQNIPINLAPFGIPFKLAFLGVPIGDPWKIAKLINQAFTVVVLVLTVMAARKGKEGGPRMRAELWLSVLTLGTLRSPFAPVYVTFPLFWLFSLWSTEVRGARGILTMAGVWILMGIARPLTPTQIVIASFLQQGLLIGILVYLVVRKPPPETLEAQA